MVFEYTYRDSSGACLRGVVECSNRQAAFEQLKADGISVISLTETKSFRKGPPEKGTRTGSRPMVIRGIAAGCAVVGLAIACWYVLSGTGNTHTTVARKSVRPQTTVSETKKTTAPIATNSVPDKSPEVAPRVIVPDVVAPQVTTNETLVATNNVITLPTNELSSVHRNATEQLLMWVFMTPLGNMPPPLPKLPKCDEKRMWEILTSPIPTKDGDTARQQDAKQTIEAAKKELKEYLRKGGDINEFFNYYHGQLKLAHMQFQESQKSVIRACRDEDPEVAREYVEKVNRDLAEKGIKPVIIPPKFKQKLGLE